MNTQVNTNPQAQTPTDGAQAPAAAPQAAPVPTLPARVESKRMVWVQGQGLVEAGPDGQPAPQPATQPPQAPAQQPATPGASPDQPQSQAQQPQGQLSWQQTMALMQQQRQQEEQNRLAQEQYQQQLAAQFALEGEDANHFTEQQRPVVAKLLAKATNLAVQQALQQVLQMAPGFVGQQVAQAHADAQREAAFYGQHKQLDTPEIRQKMPMIARSVMTSLQQSGQQWSPEDIASAIAGTAYTMFKITPQQMQQAQPAAQQPQTPANPVDAAAASVIAAMRGGQGHNAQPTPARAMGAGSFKAPPAGGGNPWEQMAEDFGFGR